MVDVVSRLEGGTIEVETMLQGKKRWAAACRAVAVMLAVAGCGAKTSAGGSPDTDGGGGGSSAVDGGDASGLVRPVTPARHAKVTKVDLLFMIDNSSSMADKHALLAQAVPDLINRLVDPVCVDRATGQNLGSRLPDGSCSVGVPDFDPVKDIHVGIITSSLGGHGSMGVCDDPDPRKALPHNDDHGHLVARNVNDVPVATFMNQGFLNWNPVAMPGQMPADVTMPFATMVTGVGQHGCGYEASLEAAYHFLVDPEPYQSVVIDQTPSSPLGVAALQGTDMVLLQQRYDFLRPDSAVAIVMMTDENDCSVTDFGQGFYSIIPAMGTPATSVLAHGTTPCLTNPNDPCCYNCFQPTPAGCPDKSVDPECQAGPWTRDRDQENLRCWRQKQRYGVDFLYPVERYIEGFRGDMVRNRAAEPVPNPLFSDLSAACRMTGQGCAPKRDKELVFVEGIIGVPWQDIAVDPNDLTKGYLTAEELTGKGVWRKILGAPKGSPPVPPLDPHMVESIVPRQGLPGPSSAVNADPIHGHEWDPSMSLPPNADLQFACTFPLASPRTCTEPFDCDCFVAPGANAGASAKPLCQNPTSGEYSNVQTRAKAYPGLRQLDVLRGLGNQATVASICPANVTNTIAADFGYRPAIAALVRRMGSVLRGRCLRPSVTIRADGTVPCALVEAFTPPDGAVCSCNDKPGRVPADPRNLTSEIRAQGTCFCEIAQLQGADRSVCQTVVSPPASVASGWCYVDPSQAGADREAQCAIVRACPPDDRRLIRFVNPDSEPRAGTGFLVCDRVGGSIGPDPCP